MAGREGEVLLPLFNIGYSDNAPMITLGGAIADEPCAQQIRTVLKDKNMGAFLDEQRHLKINVPPLTLLTGNRRQDPLRNDSRQLSKPCGLQIVRCTRPMHKEHLPSHCALRERSHDGPDGGPPRGSARGDGSSPGIGRTSLRFDQAVDGPWRLPDAATRERPCGVQSHRFGLQHAASNQPRRYSGHDFGRNGVKGNFALL